MGNVARHVRPPKGAVNTRTGTGTEASAEGIGASRDGFMPNWRSVSLQLRRWVGMLAQWWLIPPAGAVLAIVTCLVVAGAPGFPEDDGWIHQDFARTLANTGRFAFQPGRSGAGSTSPLWVLLLTPLHLVTRGRAPIWLVVGWSALLGGLALAGLSVLSGVAAAELARRSGASARIAGIVAGIAGLSTVGEWHLIWAAVSGMETDLFAFLAFLLIVAASRRVHPLWLGLLAGVIVAARPEGALAAILVLAGAAWGALRRRTAAGEQVGARSSRLWSSEAVARFGAWLRYWALPFAAGMLVCVVPYVALNLAASGHILPSTFYAKQAGIVQTGGTLDRLRGYVVQMGVVLVLVNPVLLVMAALLGGYWLHRHAFASRLVTPSRSPRAARHPSARQQHAAPHAMRTPKGITNSASDASSQATDYPLATLLWLWPLVLATTFAIRLPGAWQYGRYLMPALPALVALGAARLAVPLQDVRLRVLPFAGTVVVIAALLSLGGASALYASNVHDINGYHVAAALWLQKHTAPGSLIATHDIGAIGYFSDRPVVDFAGLADPELIPLLGNQAALEDYLRQHHVAYVVMRPDWFPPPALMAHGLAGHMVYQACGLGECFVVYRTGW
jgi:hypothetical protein